MGDGGVTSSIKMSLGCYFASLTTSGKALLGEDKIVGCHREGIEWRVYISHTIVFRKLFADLEEGTICNVNCKNASLC